MSDQIEAWLPGQSITAERLNAQRLVGAVVFNAFRAATQEIPISTVANTPVQWDEVEIDHFSGWSASSPAVYTCRFAGWYELTASAGYATHTTGLRIGQLFRNGTVIPRSFSRTAATASGGAQVPPRPRAVLLTVGDQVEYRVGQNSSVALNLTADTPSGTYISAKFVQPPTI